MEKISTPTDHLGREEIIRRPHVLIVDDSLTNLAVMLALTRSLDTFYVSGYTDTQDALRAVSASPPNTIVIDYHMPNLDGLAFVRAIWGTCNCSPPIIMVSHDRSPELKQKAAALGIFKFIEKPFEVHLFRSVLQRAAGLHS